LLGCIAVENLKDFEQGFTGDIPDSMTVLTAGEDSFFARKLRRREPLRVYDLRTTPVRKIEKQLGLCRHGLP